MSKLKSSDSSKADQLNGKMENIFHTLDLAQSLERLKSRADGLTLAEAEARLKEFGPNELDLKVKKTKFQLLLGQFTNWITYILLAATVLSFIVGKILNGVVILVIIILNALIGFIQEARADAALAALKSMSSPEADVIRNCNEPNECIELKIKARELVPGDIILLETGDKVPADARLIEIANLDVDESMLTGESLPVHKNLDTVAAESSLGDRKNLVYAGTIVTAGRGRAVVFSTGFRTEMGKIARLIESTEEVQTPLQKRTDNLTKKLAYLAIIASVIVFLIGIIRGLNLLEMVFFSLAALISSIPSGMPAAITITLAVGVQRMAKRNAIIRKLQAIDALGAATTIVTDKTGTLTTNQMTVRKIYIHDKSLTVSGLGYAPEGMIVIENDSSQSPPISVMENNALKTPLTKLLTTAVLCNDAHLIENESSPGQKRWEIKGDPTEGALLVAAAKVHMQKESLRPMYPRMDEIPFDSRIKLMGVFNQNLENDGNSSISLHVKGASEVVLNLCDTLLSITGSILLTSEIREEIIQTANSYAKQGLRVLGLARIDLSQSQIQLYKASIKEGKPAGAMQFLGLMAMIDPPREEVKVAVKICHIAGITVKMATGDHKLTAEAIGKEIGIVKENTKLVSGTELETMSDAELDSQIDQISAFVRVSPTHKYRVVESLRRKGEIVGMTGDGANDAPALKAAEIGIAMGITGTDVTKETADIVLTDDNFASIVNAVEEGRVVAENIKKLVKFLITTNMGEIFTILLSLILLTEHAPLFSALMILWINLVTDGSLTVALAMEPKESDVMKRPPVNRNEVILNRELLRAILFTSIIMAGSVLFITSVYAATASIARKQTLAFTTLALLQIINAINCRSRTQSLFQLGWFSNKPVSYGVIISIVLQIIAIYAGFFNLILGTTPLTFIDWIVVTIAAGVLFIAEELRKLVFRKNKTGLIKFPSKKSE